MDSDEDKINRHNEEIGIKKVPNFFNTSNSTIRTSTDSINKSTIINTDSNLFDFDKNLHELINNNMDIDDFTLYMNKLIRMSTLKEKIAYLDMIISKIVPDNEKAIGKLFKYFPKECYTTNILNKIIMMIETDRCKHFLNLLNIIKYKIEIKELIHIYIHLFNLYMDEQIAIFLSCPLEDKDFLMNIIVSKLDYMDKLEVMNTLQLNLYQHILDFIEYFKHYEYKSHHYNIFNEVYNKNDAIYFILNRKKQLDNSSDNPITKIIKKISGKKH